MEENESIYGPGAITGSKEDANPADGRDIDIKTSNTTTINMSTETPATDQPTSTEEKAEPISGDVTNPEAKLEADLKNIISAEADAKADLKNKGIDFDAVATEYESNGGLTADTLQKLSDAGYPKSVIDAYVAGMEATSARFEQQVYDYAGGKQQYERMAQFVSAQGQGMVDTFNRVLASGDLMQIQIALQGFQAKMGQTYGTGNRSVLGRNANTTGSFGYQNKAEMITAMSDQRYGRDPAYTREVQNKTMKATFLR